MTHCIKCPKIFTDPEEYYIHLKTVHQYSSEVARRVSNIGSGWRETPQSTPDGSKVALEHQEAALRAQAQKNRPMDIPMVVSPPPKRGINLKTGWKEGADGTYNFEQQTFEKHTPENIINKVARGHITANHGILTEYTYTKDISELSEAQDKASILEARLQGYTISDPEYVSIVNAAHEQRHRVHELKKNIKPEINNDLKIEEYFRGEQGTEEHTKWKEDFMEKCVSAAARLQANNKMDVS